MSSMQGATKAITTMGIMGVFLLFAVFWGMQKAVQPNNVQRVNADGKASPYNGERAYRDLGEILASGPRVAGTDASLRTRKIIRRHLERAGLTVEEHAFDASTPLGTRNMANLVGVVEGTKPGIIILGNHYDSKYLPDIHFVGANDGGSTTAWMLEMARALGPTREGYTVWLAFYDGEEAFKKWSATDSLYGSRAMVRRLTESGEIAQVKVVINLDMIGDCYLGLQRDLDAPEWLETLVWDTAKELGYGQHFTLVRERVEDDHVPFRDVGIAALNLIDFRYGGSRLDHDRNWHTSNDTIERVCAESLQALGDVLYHVLGDLDAALDAQESN